MGPQNNPQTTLRRREQRALVSPPTLRDPGHRPTTNSACVRHLPRPRAGDAGLVLRCLHVFLKDDRVLRPCPSDISTRVCFLDRGTPAGSSARLHTRHPGDLLSQALIPWRALSAHTHPAARTAGRIESHDERGRARHPAKTSGRDASPDQIIRFAAAITIPVTKAAKQENSRRSSNTALVIGSTPVLKGIVPG